MSPYLITLVMDELRIEYERIWKRIWKETPWCLMFTDDTVLVDKNAQMAHGKLK